MAGNAPGSEPSVIALMRDAVRDFTIIVKGEIALASAEFKRSAAAGAVGATIVLVIVVLLAMAGLFASIALAFGFYAMGLSLWLSFLLVAAIYTVVGIILAAVAAVAFRKIKGPQTAARVAAQTKAYLQAALAPGQEDAEDESDQAPTGVPATATTPTASTPAQNVTLPARVPSATAAPSTTTASGEKNTPSA